MIAMKHATDRAKETLNQLDVVYNIARQAQITEDLLEIMSAAEASTRGAFSLALLRIIFLLQTSFVLT